MEARFICGGTTCSHALRRAVRYLVITIVLILASPLAALPFAAGIGTGWMVLQTKYDVDSASAYGENRPLIGIGVRGVLGAVSAGVDVAFSAIEPVAFVYDSDGNVDGRESRLSSDLIAAERLSYLRFSVAAGHEFTIPAVHGVTIQPALELFGLRNLAYRSGATDMVETWPVEAQDDVRRALDGVYVGVSGTLAYRINERISVGARVVAARAVGAKTFPSSAIRPHEDAEPRRNAWIEIGSSVTYTLRPSR